MPNRGIPRGVNLAEYEERALRTEMMDRGDRFRLLKGALGLAGESGEFVDLVKKVVFHKKEVDFVKLREELGDALWYVTACARAIGSSLEEVGRENCEKLERRYPGGVYSHEACAARVDVSAVHPRTSQSNGEERGETK